MSDRILEVDSLSIAFRGNKVVRDVSFSIDRGETVAIVGESGSGKSVTALSVMQLLPYQYASHPTGSILVDGQEVVGAEEDDMLKIRGDRVGMVFQEPMTSLNPVYTTGSQVMAAIILHQQVSPEEARKREALASFAKPLWVWCMPVMSLPPAPTVSALPLRLTVPRSAIRT